MRNIKSWMKLSETGMHAQTSPWTSPAASHSARMAHWGVGDAAEVPGWGGAGMPPHLTSPAPPWSCNCVGALQGAGVPVLPAFYWDPGLLTAELISRDGNARWWYMFHMRPAQNNVAYRKVSIRSGSHAQRKPGRDGPQTAAARAL